MKRRHVVSSLVGAAATLSGLGWGYWSMQESRRASLEWETLWWQARFERPEGGALVPADLRGKMLLLNFWATWCPPCVEELPMLDAFARERAAHGWQVVGLALDNVKAVQQFLKRVPISFPVGIAGLEALDLSRKLGNGGGQLPFTAIWGRDSQLLQVKLGPVTESDLRSWSALG